MEHEQKGFFLQVICPVYNEASNIESFLKSLCTFLRQEITTTFEIVCVDDGSTDLTNSIISQLYRQADLPLSLLTFARNFGKEAAITAGLDYCCDKSDAVIIIDVDFQHPFSAIKDFVQKWQEGHTMVYGIQRSRERESWFQRACKGLFYWGLNLISSIHIPPGAGDFRLLDKSVVKAITLCPERNRFMKGLYVWASNANNCGVLYDVHNRAEGKSRYTFSRLASLALVGVTSFSSVPLYLIAMAGITISLLSVLYGMYIILSTLVFGEAVRGYATLATLVLFLGGIQIFCTGLLGLYVGKIFEEVKKRPTYLLADVKGVKSNPDAP